MEALDETFTKTMKMSVVGRSTAAMISMAQRVEVSIVWHFGAPQSRGEVCQWRGHSLKRLGRRRDEEREGREAGR